MKDMLIWALLIFLPSPALAAADLGNTTANNCSPYFAYTGGFYDEAASLGRRVPTSSIAAVDPILLVLSACMSNLTFYLHMANGRALDASAQAVVHRANKIKESLLLFIKETMPGRADLIERLYRETLSSNRALLEAEELAEEGEAQLLAAGESLLSSLAFGIVGAESPSLTAVTSYLGLASSSHGFLTTLLSFPDTQHRAVAIRNALLASVYATGLVVLDVLERERIASISQGGGGEKGGKGSVSERVPMGKASNQAVKELHCLYRRLSPYPQGASHTESQKYETLKAKWQASKDAALEMIAQTKSFRDACLANAPAICAGARIEKQQGWAVGSCCSSRNNPSQQGDEDVVSATSSARARITPASGRDGDKSGEDEGSSWLFSCLFKGGCCGRR